MVQDGEPAHGAIEWCSFAEMARLREGGDQPHPQAPSLKVMFDWTRAFLMRPHADLGRIGDVCPYTAHAARIDSLRFGVSEAQPGDLAHARADLLSAFAQFDAIACPGKMANFRAVLLAFPQCGDASGLATLQATQKALRRMSFERGSMIGLFHDATEAPGLWNPDFRPLRAPIPILAVRALVVNDAAFVLRHPLLAPTYLRRFRVAGGRQLVSHFLRRA